MVTPPAHRPARRSVPSSARSSALAGLLVASVAMPSGCAGRITGADAEAFRRPSAARPAAADACILSPARSRVLGLPVVDTKTARIAPEVVGEKVTWRAGRRLVSAWVGIDALDVFEDLDFVTVEVDGSRLREWTTRVQPDLFVVEAPTGQAAPCNVLYVSTVGFRSGAAVRVADDLRVRLTPGEDVSRQ